MHNIAKKRRKLIIRFQSHLCKSNHPPKPLYGNFGTTPFICVLASPCRRHSTPSVNPKLPPTAFCIPGPRPSVSWLSPFSHFSIAKCLLLPSFLKSNILAFALSLPVPRNPASAFRLGWITASYIFIILHIIRIPL